MTADLSTNDRRWFPAPAFFIDADFDDEIPVMDRSPLPIRTALANMHADIIGEDRAEAHERRRMVPRESVLRTINERRSDMERQRDRLLDALVFHELTWAHLAEDCAICDRSVAL